jgi:hypothetical protein
MRDTNLAAKAREGRAMRNEKYDGLAHPPKTKTSPSGRSVCVNERILRISLQVRQEKLRKTY